MSKRDDTLMIHSISASTKANASKYSHNSIQGHYHSLFEISYWADMRQLRWSMSVGCLADPHSVASRYGAGLVHKRPILGCGVLAGNEGSTLVISDLHLPYQHRDSFDFLAEVYDSYNCDEVLNVGDIIDHHRGSYHDSEPDALDASTEYELAQKLSQELQGLFPDMIITMGNHDMLPRRKLKSAGMPETMLGDNNALYGLNDGWVWKDRHEFDSRGRKPILLPMELKTNGRWNKKVLPI